MRFQGFADSLRAWHLEHVSRRLSRRTPWPFPIILLWIASEAWILLHLTLLICKPCPLLNREVCVAFKEHDLKENSLLPFCSLEELSFLYQNDEHD